MFSGRPPVPTLIRTSSDAVSLFSGWISMRFASWCCGRASDLRSRGRGFESRPGTRCKNLGQVSHTYVPLSPSSISWYWPKGGDARRLRR